MSPAPPSTTSGPAKAPSTPDPVMLSIFSNRFMSVAEAMGKTLQQTAISTNIKERLDYSCALFSPTAHLVANAPFVPVHLGSMSFTVQWQLNLHGDSLRPGDVLMTNHPTAGNSHLPDITLITPVFEGDKIIFFVASRGHHADIGGILAGSMPPTSTELYQEGAMCRSFFIVKGGTFNREELYRIMVEEPAQYEGCSGCRSFSDVESDLKAQIAANHKGAQLIGKLIKEYGLPTVHAYMDFIRDNAELAIRELLKKTATTYGTKLSALDHMDDGSPIALEITIDPADGSAVFDFEGTGPEVRGCWNAPEAVVHAAIIYCLRALCAVDMPLNGGCLAPIDVRIPQNSFLSPSDTAAVCGGNVVTSQRVTDVVLKAFNACADSQGCCNNLTFGAGGKDEHGNVKAGWGYYETICGGSGAGPTWEGTSAVQVHMTNTRITDVELAERRYPVIIHQFAIRRDGGGQGKFNGGNGVVREFEFTEPLQVSILSERRVHRPSGMHGGLPGAAGVNHWVKKGARLEDGSEAPAKTVNIGGKASVMMAAGDRLLLKTPGGGGWGAPSERAADEASKQAFVNNWAPRGSLADHAAKQEGQ